MKFYLLVQVQEFELPTSGNEVHFNTTDMARLGKLFNTRYITPVMTGTEAGIQSTEMRIEIDGAQPLTQEQWNFICTNVYKLRFIPPMLETSEETVARASEEE